MFAFQQSVDDVEGPNWDKGEKESAPVGVIIFAPIFGRSRLKLSGAKNTRSEIEYGGRNRYPNEQEKFHCDALFHR